MKTKTSFLPLRRTLRLALLAAALPLCATAVHGADHAAPRPAALFGNGAVLQQGKPIPVWGTAGPGDSIRVKFRSQSATTRADASGKWAVELKPEKAGGSDPLIVEGPGGSFTAKEVQVGEVWLASGQSNMVFTLQWMKTLMPTLAPLDPQLRVFNVNSKGAEAPAETVNGTWGGFTQYNSAVAYFFGKELHKQLNVPVGIITSAVGGTSIRSWIGDEAAKNVPEQREAFIKEWQEGVAQYPAKLESYQAALASWTERKSAAEASGAAFRERKPMQPTPPIADRSPFGLFNGKIHPLAPYALSGVIWYQGESDSDAKSAPYYAPVLRAMIQDWRTLWKQPHLPFLIVQLPCFHMDWAAIRAAQEEVARDPYNGRVVTLDVGESGNIHPLQKEPVGMRLAHLALADVYGKKIPAHSPAPLSAKREGSAVRVAFACDEGASLVYKGTEASGAEVAGADGKFFAAQARAEQNSLVFSAPEVSDPEEVRYAWKGDPAVTIFDSNGLPAPPFLLKVGAKANGR